MNIFKIVFASVVVFFLAGAVAAQHGSVSVSVTVDESKSGPQIDRNIHGQMTEHKGTLIYDGIWVGTESKIPNTRGIRNDVVAALKKLNVPLVRWPGGCFADGYHWRDGIGPRESRPKRMTAYAQIESNQFGTHEFMDFMEQIGAEPYINVNVGTGTVDEAKDWLEYLTAEKGSLADLRRENGRSPPWKVKYLGVGNEMWGCGGGMRADDYVAHLRRYGLFLSWDPMSGDERFLIASGPLNNDYEWTRALTPNATWTFPATDISLQLFRGIALHYYTFPDGAWAETTNIGPALGFNEKAWFSVLRAASRMDELLAQNAAVMDQHDPDKKVALAVDEWGTWYQSPDPKANLQQNSLRDALVAALTLNIFHRHADRLKLATIANMINIFQSVILTDKEKMLLTPTYHVFDLYQPFQGALSYRTEVSGPTFEFEDELPVMDVHELPMIDASAAKGSDGKLYLSLVNLDPNRSAEVATNLSGIAVGRILTGMAIDAHNTFAAPGNIYPVPFYGTQDRDGRVRFKLPAKSVAVVAVEQEH